VEGVWRYLKRVELANVVCQSLAHLHWSAPPKLYHRLH